MPLPTKLEDDFQTNPENRSRETAVPWFEDEANALVLSPVAKIVVTQNDGKDELSVDLHGDLAGIWRIATENKLMKDKGKIENRLEAIAANDNDNIVLAPPTEQRATSPQMPD